MSRYAIERGRPICEHAIDSALASRFVTHIGVARDVLVQVEQLPERVALTTGTGVDHGLMDTFVNDYAKRWETMWEQLQLDRSSRGCNAT